MLEWNNKLLEAPIASYSSLAKSDDNQFFSAASLPATLSAACLLVIDINTQSLRLVEYGRLKKTYQISTAANGAGCQKDTGCTPLGWHKIAEKIGKHEPLGAVFKGRRATGAVAGSLSSDDDDDLITSRILRLSGLQPGVNSGGSVDSYSRYVYIHGTAQEHLIGRPVSHGCIRMRNDDIIELFDRVDEKTITLVCRNLTEYNTAH